MTVSAASPRSAFAYRAFTIFFVGRVISLVSFHVMMVAIGWQLYSLTGSALDLGLLGVAQFLPMVALTLFVGHAADCYDGRGILAGCMAIQASGAVIMALGSAMGWLSPAVIYLIMILIGAGRAFEIPTAVSLIPAIVPRENVPSATAWFVSANQVGMIAGPILGGVLYGLGPGAVYGIAVAMWCVAVGFILMIAMEPVRRTGEPVSIASLMGGFHFVWRDRVILGIISLDLLAVFVGAAVGLFPIFARDILQTGAWGLGLLRAAPAVGAAAMSMVLGRWPLTLPIGAVLFAMLALFGCAIIVFAFSTSLILSLAALAAMGVADAVSVVIRFSLVQLRTPAEMRGRVSAVNGMFTGTSNYLGDFRAGAVAALIGAVPAVAVGGFGVLLITAAWMALFPQLWRLRTYDELPAAQVLSGDSGKERSAP